MKLSGEFHVEKYIAKKCKNKVEEIEKKGTLTIPLRLLAATESVQVDFNSLSYSFYGCYCSC